MIGRLVGRLLAPQRHDYGNVVVMFGPASTMQPALGSRMMGDSVFADTFSRGSNYVEAERGWSPLRTLGTEPPPAGITETERNSVQEVLLQLASFATVAKRRIPFDVVAGISLGEIAAGHAVGVLSLEEALDVCFEMVDRVALASGGDLVLIQASPEAARKALGSLEVDLIIDWPARSVWAVRDELRAEMKRNLRSSEIAYSALRIKGLSHTRAVNREEFSRALAHLGSTRPARPYFSSHAGGQVDAPLDGAYWATVYSEPVRLSDVMSSLQALRCGQILYIGSVELDSETLMTLAEPGKTCRYTTVESLVSRSENSSVVSR